jgi:hypothetical protein
MEHINSNYTLTGSSTDVVVIISMIRSQRFDAVIGPRNSNIKVLTFQTKDHDRINTSLQTNNNKMQEEQENNNYHYM